MPLVPRLHRYYAALRLPDHLRPALCSRSRSAYLVDGRFFFPAAHASMSTQLSESGDRRSASPDIVEERSGPPRLLDRPLATCRGHLPRRMRRLLAHVAGGAAAFRLTDALDIRNRTISRLVSHGPRPRVPTHRRRRCRRRRKAHYRPAGLSLGRTGFAPAGRFTEFPKSPLFLSDQHFLVAPANCRATIFCSP